MTKFSDIISHITRRHNQACLQENDAQTSDYNRHAERRISSLSSESGRSEGSEGEKESSDREQPQMEACLTTFDLVSLGVGSCLGTGMYLTTGMVASTMTGPSGAVSIFIAGLFSMLTGLCYAELAGLCPKTSGSAYMYAYITLGELAAFVIGWGLVVEYVIGTAAGAVALSETLSSLSDDYLETFMANFARAVGLPKLDLVAAAICLMLTLILASGAEMSAKVNNILNITNIAVLVFFAIASLVLGNKQNLVIGGFFPFGVSGMVRAIPTCYFAYIGFDTVAATGEEARDPSRSIPRSILLSILINCTAYIIVISGLTYCLPFYLLHHDTAMTDVFPQVGFIAGKYIVAVGAVSGEFAATFGSMFPLPRVLSAMAGDGLVFRVLSKICPKRRTPVRATLLSGFVAMVMATFFNLELLIELVLIGTLLAYVLVTFALLYMRYVITKPRISFKEPVLVTEYGTVPIDDMESEPPLSPTKENCKPVEELTVHRRILTPPKKQRNTSRSPPFSSKADDTFDGACLKKTSQSTSDRDKNLTRNGDLHGKQTSSSSSKLKILPPKWTKKFFERTSPKKTLLSKPSKLPPGYSALEDTSDFEDEFMTGNLTASASLSRQSTDGLKKQSPSKDRRERHLPNSHSNGHEGASTTDERKYDRKPPKNTHEKASNSNTQKKSVCQHNKWLKSITSIADKISASPRKTISLLAVMYGLVVVLCSVMSTYWKGLADGNILALGVLGVLSAALLALVGLVCFLHENKKGKEFRAPLVPALPVLVALFNIHLMTSLSLVTWLLFAVWMVFGLCIYFFYGIKNSSAGQPSNNYQMVSLHDGIPLVLDDPYGFEEEEVNSQNN